MQTCHPSLRTRGSDRAGLGRVQAGRPSGCQASSRMAPDPGREASGGRACGGRDGVQPGRGAASAAVQGSFSGGGRELVKGDGPAPTALTPARAAKSPAGPVWCGLRNWVSLCENAASAGGFRRHCGSCGQGQCRLGLRSEILRDREPSRPGEWGPRGSRGRRRQPVGARGRCTEGRGPPSDARGCS